MRSLPARADATIPSALNRATTRSTSSMSSDTIGDRFPGFRPGISGAVGHGRAQGDPQVPRCDLGFGLAVGEGATEQRSIDDVALAEDAHQMSVIVHHRCAVNSVIE